MFQRSGMISRGRDGCRVPCLGPDTARPSVSPGSGAHLAAPARRLGSGVARQTDDASSMLELYRTALRMRRLLPALGDGCLQWLSMPEGALGFAREPGFLCVVNYSAAPVVLPDDAVILLASDEFDPGRVCRRTRRFGWTLEAAGSLGVRRRWS